MKRRIMSRMDGCQIEIGGACREDYGGSLGDDPLRQVATDGLTCVQKHEPRKPAENTDGAHVLRQLNKH